MKKYIEPNTEYMELLSIGSLMQIQDSTSGGGNLPSASTPKPGSSSGTTPTF